MAAIRLVTDSASDLDEVEMSARGVAVVPLDVRLGEVGPEVSRTWSPEEFWRQCATTDVLPETSAPSPGAFRDAFAAARENGAEGIVCVTISSRLSATYQAAAAAADSFSDCPVRVVDSRSVTMGEGIGVLAGLEAAERGDSLDEVERAVTEALSRTKVYGTFDTLDNLRKGGRVGGAQAIIGSLLSIKPVIEIRDGQVEPESRQRTRGRSLEYLASKVKEAAPLRRLAVMHAAAGDIDVLVSMLAEVFPRDEILVTYIGPVIGTHSGRGAIGVCFEKV